MQQAYSYEPTTGLYMGPVPADESPMEPGVLLLPAFSTDKKPPATASNEIAQFDLQTGEWRVLPIEPAAPAPQVLPFSSPDTRTKAMRDVISAWADTVAQAYDFDSMADAVSYADEPSVPSYQKLGRALRAWRSVLWNAFDSKVAEINIGAAPVPESDEALIALMPAFEPPSE